MKRSKSYLSYLPTQCFLLEVKTWPVGQEHSKSPAALVQVPKMQYSFVAHSSISENYLMNNFLKKYSHLNFSELKRSFFLYDGKDTADLTLE